MIVDTTPPVVTAKGAELVGDSLIIRYEASDPGSYVKVMFVGLGTTSHDVSIMEWLAKCTKSQLSDGTCAESGERTATIDSSSTVPLSSINLIVGKPFYVRVSAVNNARMRTKITDSALVIHDTTAPIAGTVYNGGHKGHDRVWFGGRDIEAVWTGFDDPESGIKTVRADCVMWFLFVCVVL